MATDVRFSPDDDAFRQEVRAFIRDHYPPEMRVKNPYTDLTKQQSRRPPEARAETIRRPAHARRPHRRGISLFIVDKLQSGIDCRDYATVDGRRAADIVSDDVAVGSEMRVGPEGDGLVGLERAVDHAFAALCAEAVGAMDELNRTTRDYARLRKQFGVLLAKFQVLQHWVVDMFIAYEQALLTSRHYR